MRSTGIGVFRLARPGMTGRVPRAAGPRGCGRRAAGRAGRCLRRSADRSRCSLRLVRRSARQRGAGRRHWCAGGPSSSSRRASGQDSGFESPPSARRQDVGTDYGAIDHLHVVRDRAALGGCAEHGFPDARLGPTPVLAEHNGPVAESVGQVAPRCPGPRDSEHAVQNASMIRWWPAALRTARHHEGREERSLRIRHQAAQTHDRFPKSDPESRRCPDEKHFAHTA